MPYAGIGGDGKAVASMGLEKPPELHLEIKAGRDSSFSLSERDLKGIDKENGYLVTILLDTTYKAPFLGLVSNSKLSPGIVHRNNLAKIVIDTEWAVEINTKWSDWIFDAEARNKIISSKHSEIPGKIDWYWRHHGGPRESGRPVNAVRAMKLTRSLDELREEIDDIAKKGAQTEGHFHQYLVKDILERRLGYTATNNPTGVPDITAYLKPAPF